MNDTETLQQTLQRLVTAVENLKPRRRIPQGVPRDGSKVDRAASKIREMLVECNDKVLLLDLQRMARLEGFSDRTMERARRVVDVKPYQLGHDRFIIPKRIKRRSLGVDTSPTNNGGDN